MQAPESRTPAPAPQVRPIFPTHAPSAPPAYGPSSASLSERIRAGEACSYCPVERKRPAYRAVAASEGTPEGTLVIVRFVCAACDIAALDEVLGAPGRPALRQRIAELEELVLGLQEDVRNAAMARERGA